jgi:hypothetical protein
MIFTFSWYLVSIANTKWVPRDTVEVLWFSKTAAEDTGMSVYQNSEAASAYRFGPTLAQWFGDIMKVMQ